MRSQKKLKKIDFRTTSPTINDPGYDLEYDKMLIEQSIAKQYHILPSAQEDIQFSDWILLVGGLMDDTPLGRVVSVRTETDPEMIKVFTPEQRKLRTEWANFRLHKALETQDGNDLLQSGLNSLQSMFANMFSKRKEE